MNALIRPATPDDLPALYEMAKLAGGGFTNLPPDRGALRAKLDRSALAFADHRDQPGDDLFVLMLEKDGQVCGTCQVFALVGQSSPFYSYRLSTLTQQSRELDRTIRAEMLSLTTDLEGSSEVGGLFLHPSARAGGLGALLARSRYLFIRAHRARFADWLLAELRGLIDDAGDSAFWDGLAGRFFGMDFAKADEFNATHGHQFIADLMPKHPVYVALLPDAARNVIGKPHPSGRPAMRMLEAEGFTHDEYVDIFDGGPTMLARTDEVRTIRDARAAVVERLETGGDIGAARQRTARRLPRHLRRCDGPGGRGRGARPRDCRPAERRDGRVRAAHRALMLREVNFDGLIGPTHNYAGLSPGNLASAAHAGAVSRPRAAALQGLAKMRANLRLGLVQGVLPPLDRPNDGWLESLGTGVADAPPHLRAAAFSASAMWAANAATVSPAPDANDGRCHLTVANLRTMPHRAHEWPGTLATLRLAFAHPAFAVHGPVPASFGDEGAANHMRLAPAHGQAGVELFVFGRTGGPFAARQSEEACRAIARLHALDPDRTLFVEQSEAAIAAGAFHNDVVAVANERLLLAHAQAFAEPDRVADWLARVAPWAEVLWVDPDRGQPSRRDPLLPLQRPAGHRAHRRVRPDRAGGGDHDAIGARVAGRPDRRQRADPPGGGRGRARIDGEWRRSGVPAPAGRLRPRDVGPALPAGRGPDRPGGGGGRGALAGPADPRRPGRARAGGDRARRPHGPAGGTGPGRIGWATRTLTGWQFISGQSRPPG